MHPTRDTQIRPFHASPAGMYPGRHVVLQLHTTRAQPGPAGLAGPTWVHLGPIALQIAGQLAVSCSGLAQREQGAVGVVHRVCQVVCLQVAGLP